MHILIIASWYKSDQNPTAGSFIEEQARMLQKAGHKVVVMHPFINGTFRDTIKGVLSINSTYNDNEMLTTRISTNVIIPKYRGYTYFFLYKKTQKYLVDYILQNGKPDIIHSHALFMGGVIGYYLSKEFNIPQFHTEHTSGLISDPEQYTKSDIKLLNEVYKNCKKVFFVSNYFNSEMQKHYKLTKANLMVLPNMVHQNFFNYINPEHTNIFNFIAIGNLVKIKAFDFLLQAWSIFKQHDNESYLTIAGSGPELDSLNNLIDVFNLHNSVKIIPRLSRPEVKNHIDNSHVLLSTSKLETFGLTVAEAVACGRPVVVTDSGGVRDIVNTSNGIITDFNIDAFANALANMKSNFHSYNLKQISKDTKLRFGEAKILQTLHNRYENNIISL